jgi:hypothetical protein
LRFFYALRLWLATLQRDLIWWACSLAGTVAPRTVTET